MKTVLTLAAALFATTAFAQIPGKKSNHPIEINGTTYGIGDTIYFQTGTLPDGAFKYIYNQSPMLDGPAYMPSSLSGMRLQIKFFKTQGNRAAGYKTYAVVNPGALNYAVDLEQAIKTGEIRVGHIRS